MNQMLAGEPEVPWEELVPHFDAALCELSEADRDALFLRYFERKSARDIASQLGISAEAAQKRVTRAIERLRELFGRRGLPIEANSLAVLIASKAVQAAPPVLTKVIWIGALAAISTKTTALTTTKLILMTTLQKSLIGCAVLLVIGAGLYQVHRMTHSQTESIPHAAHLGGKLSAAALPDVDPAGSSFQGAPANARRTPSIRLAQSPKSTAAVPFPSTQMYQLLKNKVPTLARAQLEPYLNAKDRSASALLAAFRTTAEAGLLAEATQKFPEDPRVAFEAAVRNGVSQQERRQWVDTLKQSAPENSFADYLSAAAHFKAGQPAEGLQDLIAAAAKPHFDDYSTDRVQGNEEAYSAAGYSAGEAKLLANNFLPCPQLIELNELGQDLVRLAAAYQSSGDPTSRETVLQMAATLGRRFDDPSTKQPLSSQLIGINIERSALAAMNPATAYGTTGHTIQQRLDELAQQKEAIHVLTSQADPLWSTLSDQDWIAYQSQIAASGEETALRWLVTTYTRK